MGFTAPESVPSDLIAGDLWSWVRTLSDYLPLFTGKPLEFEPGTAQRYSNAGYVVLGLVVERITGKRFADAARERIFMPAGMAASGWRCATTITSSATPTTAGDPARSATRPTSGSGTTGSGAGATQPR